MDITQKRHHWYAAWAPSQRYWVDIPNIYEIERNRYVNYTGLDCNTYWYYVETFVGLSVVFGAFTLAPVFIAPTRPNLEQMTAYECGFDAFTEAKTQFNINFYTMAILYLIFDIEIMLALPYCICKTSEQEFWIFQAFLVFLVTGFFYEWGAGALEWND